MDFDCGPPVCQPSSLPLVQTSSCCIHYVFLLYALCAGPTALIQFRIWQRGSLDMRQLKDRLTCAVGHALCDIITEFTLLAAPVCMTPRNLQDLKVLPVTSLPNSPVTVKSML